LERSLALKKTRASELRFRTIFERSKDVIFTSNRQLEFQNVNYAGTELFGFERDELLHHNTQYLFVNISDKNHVLKTLNRRKKIVDHKIELRAQDKSIKTCLFSASLENDEIGRIYIQGMIHDISMLKKIEEVRLQAEILESKGVQVKYAIHPVAGRMPGHMNVLLAEADVSYEKLLEMEVANEEFPSTDVVLILGANDVVNPAAKHDPSSPIYGMPILDVELAKMVIVNKRSMKPGYAGIENELFYQPKTSMLFGDAKKALNDLVAEIKSV